MTQQTPVAGTDGAGPLLAQVPATRSGAARPRQPVGGVGDLFQHLRDGRARTRAELVETTGLSRTTIASRVDRLLESGLVTAVGEAASTGGRPPARFAFAPGSRVVVGADLGVTHGVVELTDLAGEVLAAQAAPLRIEDGPERVLDWVVRTASRLLEGAGRSPEDLVGTGIGLPGPVDHGTGRPVRPPIMPGWDDADVRGLVGASLPGVVLADNDVNLMALGEHVHAWREADHLLVVKASTGIGLGIISGGRLDRGARGAAGDLGHVQVPGRDDTPCTCGHTGCLEAVAGGGALARALAADGARAAGVGDVVELVRDGDARAVAAVRAAGRDLGRVLATCVNILNPSVVVLGGSLAEVGDHLLAGVREVVYARSLPLATADLRLVPSQMGDRAAVAGASAMVAEHALSPEVVDAACA